MQDHGKEWSITKIHWLEQVSESFKQGETTLLLYEEWIAGARAERKDTFYSVMAVGSLRDDGGLDQSHGNKHEEMGRFWRKN